MNLLYSIYNELVHTYLYTPFVRAAHAEKHGTNLTKYHPEVGPDGREASPTSRDTSTSEICPEWLSSPGESYGKLGLSMAPATTTVYRNSITSAAQIKSKFLSTIKETTNLLF
jgi:hypothetical protein